MVQVTDRLERFVADSGDCCDGDVAECEIRLGELAETASADIDTEDVDVFAALGNETRYTLVRLLHAAGDELCVCELDALVDATESAVSHALRTLREAGLVTVRKDGRWRYYRATPRATAVLVALDGTRGVDR